jgi:uncharacterized lipoprotein YmbA
MRIRKISSLVVGLAWSAAGCTFLQPQPDPSRYFVLTPLEQRGEPAPRKLMLGLGPVRFPEYLARPQLVRRTGRNQLHISQIEMWAEPLERNFKRVLSQDLGALLGTQEILLHPWFTSISIDYEIPMEVLRFEPDEEGTVRLEARWGIREPKEDRLLYSAESRVAEAATDASTEATVTAMSAAVGKLSEEIAREIRRVSAGGGR